MTAAVHPAQDDAPDIDIGIKTPAAHDHGSRCPCDLVAVDNQNDRRVEELGQLRCAELACGIHSVKESPIAFNERNGAFCRMA